MSELKAYIGPHPTDHTLTEYYLKSEADKVIAHHKHKRCVAMADYCAYKAWYFKYKGEEEKFYRWMKFRLVWRELAKQFKEEK